jgi:dolichol-phosphate mannosyltransferase
MEPELSIIFPTYNEAENIEELIERTLNSSPVPTEVIVVDDNSPDGTWKLVEDLNKENVRCIRRIDERGLSSALMRGIKESLGKYVMWMDADLCMPPEKIPLFLEKMQYNDIVIGSRYAKGAKDDREMLRVVTSRMINTYANLLLNFKVKDWDSGFVMAKKEVFDKVQFRTKGYGEYCMEFLYKCTLYGYRIKELPYVFTDRERGVSKTAPGLMALLGHGYKYGKSVLLLRLKGKKY